MRTLFFICLLAQSFLLQAQKTLDYRSFQSPVKDQQKRGTCTAFSIVGMLETMPGFPNDLSEQYLYATAKYKYFDSVDFYDEGARLSYYPELLQVEGTMREDQMPYNPDAPVWTETTSKKEKMRKDLGGVGVLDLYRIYPFMYRVEKNLCKVLDNDAAMDIDLIKQKLDKGIVNIPVTYRISSIQWSRNSGRQNEKIDPTGLIDVIYEGKRIGYNYAYLTIPQLEQKLRAGMLDVAWLDDKVKIDGGHAVAIVGYDENGFLIKNSWGTEWGDKGYCWVSFKFHKAFVRQVMIAPLGCTRMFKAKPDAVCNPSEIYLKSLPARPDVKQGMQLSLVFHTESIPDDLKEVEYSIYDCNGKMVETNYAKCQGIFEGRLTGYNNYVLMQTSLSPFCNYTVKAAFTTKKGKKFTNTYTNVTAANKEYAPE